MINRKAFVFVLLGVVLSVGIAGIAQQPMGNEGERVRLLLVDETKTFSSTMRVGVLAGILKKGGLFDVDVKLVEVDKSYTDPLVGSEPPAQPYDIILIIPRGIDSGAVRQIWIVTRGLVELPPPVAAAFEVVEGIVEKVFAKLAVPIDVSDDLYLAFFSALYVAEGWL